MLAVVGSAIVVLIGRRSESAEGMGLELAMGI